MWTSTSNQEAPQTWNKQVSILWRVGSPPPASSMCNYDACFSLHCNWLTLKRPEINKPLCKCPLKNTNKDLNSNNKKWKWNRICLTCTWSSWQLAGGPHCFSVYMLQCSRGQLVHTLSCSFHNAAPEHLFYTQQHRLDAAHYVASVSTHDINTTHHTPHPGHWILNCCLIFSRGIVTLAHIWI